MCSAVPGRQRWKIPEMVGRRHLAEVLQEAMESLSWIRSARANHVTGTVLVLYDENSGAAGVRGVLEGVLSTILRCAADQKTGGPSGSPAGGAARRPVGGSDGGRLPGTVLAVAGGATAAAALASGKLLRKPVVVLGAVAAATAVVVRRALRGAATTTGLDSDGDTDAAGSAGGPPPDRRSSLRALLDIAGPHKARLGLASGLSAVCQLAEVTLGLFLGWTALVLIKGECPPLLALGLTSASSQLWFLAGAAATACAAVAGLSYAAGVAWRRLGQDVQHDWRNSTYAHVQRLELGQLEGERTTRIAGVLTDEVAQLGAFFTSSANDVVQLATSFLILAPAFLLFAPQIAWIAFLPMPFVAWLSLRYHDRAAADYAVSSENRARLHSQLVNSLEAGATVKSFCTEDYEAGRVEGLGEVYRDSNLRTDRSSVRHSETVRACTTASMAGTLLLGGRLVLDGTLSFEVFSPLIGLPQQVLLRLTRLGGIVDQYQRTLTAYARVRHLHALPTEPLGAEHPVDRGNVAGALTLERVTFAYRGRPPVLNDLSLQIAPGKVTGIVGATGSGKTTVAKLLMRFQDADCGRVLLDGRDVRDLSRHGLRHAVGFVAQDPFLFDGTIADNIRYGSFDASREQVERAARMAEAHTFIEDLPERYDTHIGERGSALSGGQRQRIALARAILKDSPVVILDEATSAVDNETEAAIQHALRTFAEDRTLLVIAHRLSTIRNADWIYVLDRGGIVAEQGTHVDLLARHGPYTSLWQLQAGERADRPAPLRAPVRAALPRGGPGEPTGPHRTPPQPAPSPS
ncbi:ATP-binding cassette domain-containing protein [Streptomyces sp. NPDC059851]|uniref:ABC transporter ATP-binding protein/permease n=1 Tax=Streptomyces sp. NPDC059851 TaxID=3346971 RepID=UPI00364B8474